MAKITKTKKRVAVLLFGLLSLGLGFLAGLFVWAILKILAAGTEFLDIFARKTSDSSFSF